MRLQSGSRWLPRGIAGLTYAALLVLLSAALAGCGGRARTTPAPVIDKGQSNATANQRDAERSTAPVAVEEPARDAQADILTAPSGVPAPSPTVIPPGVSDPIVVALLLPLSGQHAALGKALKDAAFLALFELGDPRLVLLPRDTKGTAFGAQAAAEQALQDGARLILGPLFRDAVAGAAIPARERGVNVVAFSTDRSVAGDGVYLLGFTPEQQVHRVLQYATGQGMQRFAALAPDSPYGYAIVAAMQKTLPPLGGELTTVEFYAADGSNASDAVIRLSNYEQRKWRLKQRRKELAGQKGKAAQRERRRLKDADTYGELPYEALLLPEGGQTLRAVAPLLSYYDVDGVKFLGTGLWDDPGTTREPALVGGWFAAPSPESAGDFQRRFKATYGRQAPRIATLAYDAAALAAVLASGEQGPRFDRETLSTASGFAGNDGIFRFQQDGVAERGLAVLEVSTTGFEVIDAAPDSFESFVFRRRPDS